MKTGRPPTDRLGQTFKSWTVFAQGPHAGESLRWWCRCQCGAEDLFYGSNLTAGRVRVCECLRTISNYKRPEYQVWKSMKARCCNPNAEFYSRYGGRGVKICDRWLNDFDAFFADMGPRPSPKHSIERGDNDGDYAPGNCRWATSHEQAWNKSTNRRLEMNGVVKCVAEWAAEYGIRPSRIITRLDRDGRSVVDAITTPARTDGQRAPDGR